MEVKEDQLLLTQLKNQERNAFLRLYDLYFPILAAFVRKNKGSADDAEDNFQDTLIVLMNKLKDPEFKLNASLKTYLYAINQNLWLKKLRSKGTNDTSEDLENLISEADFLTLQQLKEEEEKRSGWLGVLMERITGHCVILITRIFFKLDEPDDLIKELGYKNTHTFHNQKYKCINQLRRAAKNIDSAG